jgi:hypothetical protein
MSSHGVPTIAAISYLVIKELGLVKSCISGSAILARALHRFGYLDAYRLSVGVQVHNPATREWVEEYGGPPTNEAEQAAFDASDAFLITIDKTSPVTDLQWAGHVAVVVPNTRQDRHTFVDLTIPQVNRPDRGVLLRPVIAPVTDQFVNGEDQFAPMVDGSLLIYDAFPDDDSYNVKGDCMTDQELEPTVEKIIKRLG